MDKFFEHLSPYAQDTARILDPIFQSSVQSARNVFSEFSMESPFQNMPDLSFGSDLMITKMEGWANVWDVMKNKKLGMQTIALLLNNIIFDMIEQNLELEPQTIGDQLFEVLRVQMIDSIQRTSFDNTIKK
jgi:hypothetical protein